VTTSSTTALRNWRANTKEIRCPGSTHQDFIALPLNLQHGPLQVNHQFHNINEAKEKKIIEIFE
jgi:hypothetical protein